MSMIIKRWNGTSFDELYPKTKAGMLYAADGTTTIFDGNTKIKPEYLPDAVFDSLRFDGTTGSVFGATSGSLGTLTAEAIANAAATSPVRSAKGFYYVASDVFTFSQTSTTTLFGSIYISAVFAARDSASVGGADQGGDTGNNILEIGDWLVLSDLTGAGTVGNPYIAYWSVVNNTYENATSTAPGIVKYGDSATQTTAANAVTTTASRSYAIQNNGSNQMVVNVPWTDTTYAEATTTALGLVELAFAKLGTSPTLTESTTAGRYYGVSLNSNSQMQVNVPWTDTVYTHPTQTAIDVNATDDGINVIDRVQVNTAGHVTAVSTRNLSAATTSAPGHMTAADKTKLDGIATGANLYVHPTYSYSNAAGIETTLSDITLIDSISATNGHITASTSRKLVAGTNVTITPASNGNITIAATDTNTTYTAATGGGLSLSSTAFSMVHPFFAQADAPSSPVSGTVWFDI